MRSGILHRKEVLGLLASFSLALAQPAEIKIDSWGTRTFTLGNFTGEKTVNFLVGYTLGSDGLTRAQGVPGSFSVRGVLKGGRSSL
ncbi:hypothetical protein [Thermus altitudinis]|uniref:hypothetical protein n=1 Tax=Thermus altitudinis TaxID=2908145 RepID=UPI001FAB0138|nr:hypothetical protein [Thermus altitudinis]